MLTALVAVTVAAACEDSSPDESGTVRGRVDVVIASFNFTESELVAEIYAAVLEHEGVPVRRELNLGPRELVAPALRQGHVDIVPEYLGTALAAASPRAGREVGDASAARAELARALEPDGVRVLQAAPAENQNAVVVSRGTANRLDLARVSDLGPYASALTLGGPPECPTRRYCAQGLRDVYELAFDDFVPLVGATRTKRALEDGVIDVGIMFTTDGHLATRDLVLLADDRHLQPPENIVPVVREEVLLRHGARISGTLDAVSARLTTTAVRFLNWRVTVAGRDPATEARGWLTREGVLPR